MVRARTTVCQAGQVPESPEHRFLKETFLQVLVDFSSLRLFGVTEAQRRTFDFSCNVERDWSLPLVGQVDWRHRAGLDKDLRTLLGEPGTPLRALVMRDDMSNRMQLAEIVAAHRQQRPDMFTLKVFPITADFDADREDHRAAVWRELRDRVARDILFNVVFGGIGPEHVRFFAFSFARLNLSRKQLELTTFGTFGTAVAILHHLATERFISNNLVASILEVSSGHVREALTVLDGSGFITRAGEPSGGWAVTLRGRVFLELLGRIRMGMELSEWNGELGYILARLGCEAERSMAVQRTAWSDRPPVLDLLVLHIHAAERRWNVDLATAPAYRNLIPEGAFTSYAMETDPDGEEGRR